MRTATPTETKEVPNLSALVKNKHAERTEELSRLVDGNGTAEAAKPAETPSRDFDAEIEALDPDLRNHYQERVTQTFNTALSEQYGDVMPLFTEARNNPTLRKNLAQFAAEQEYRDILSDENAPKRLKNLANKKLSKLYEDDAFAEFAVTEALPIYEQYGNPNGAPAAPARSPELERIEQLEKRYDSDRDLQTRRSYVDNRIRERFALESKYPALAENQAMRNKVLGRAESDFEERARVAGIKVDDSANPGWPAQAIRAGIKPMAYMDAYNDYASFAAPAQTEAAPTGAVGDVRATRQPVKTSQASAPAEKRSLTKAELHERGVRSLQNLRATSSRKG